MYLSRLEILGFKSFAQKTVVNFNQGVTCIVGPNGCGKTNIVDAIRWSLGEQKSNTLRSDKMENVIFNGTSSKKPMGMAEVSLTIINNKGILPTEYGEVTITRRIFRSGESEYLLNKNLCRLKDITNLFMDTGMGTNAYSVIELKMVETILSSKADERRAMFEEAAGVNKYKLRRRLSLKKLDEVKTDLNRVNDIVTEVEKKVASLERQAKKADKYNRITVQLKELEIDYCEREYSLFNSKRDEFKNSKEVAARERIVIESELNKVNDELSVLKEKLSEIESLLKDKQAEIQKNTEELYKNERKISVNQERKRSLTNNVVKYKSELEELKYQLTENEETIQENLDFIQDISSKIEAKIKERDDLEAAVKVAAEGVESQKEKLKEFSNTTFEKFKEVNNKENELKNVKRTIVNLDKTIVDCNEQIHNLTSQTAKTVGYIEELNQEKTDSEKKLAEAEALYTEKQKEKETLEQNLAQLKERELKSRSAINSLKEKITFIKNLIDNLEGISKGSKMLVESDVWIDKDKILIANIGNAKDEYRTAIEAALKNNLNNIIVESFQDIISGIEILKQNDFGKASFYINSDERSSKSLLEKISDYLLNRKIKKLLKEEGVIGASYDFIIADEKWKPFFARFLNKTFITENLEIAYRLSSRYKEFSFTTLNGDLIASNGIIEAGAAPKLDDTIFGRKQLLENLKSDFPEKEAELEKIKSEILDFEQKINAIDLKLLSERGKILVNDLAAVEKQITQIEFEMQKNLDETEKVRKRLQDSVNELKVLHERESKFEKELEIFHAERTQADIEYKELENLLKSEEEKLNNLSVSKNNSSIEIERLIGEKKNAENDTERAKNSIESINKTITKRQNDIQQSEEELETIDSIIDEVQLTLDEVKSLGAKLKQEDEEIEVLFKERKRDVLSKESILKEYRESRESFLNQIHSAEIGLNECRMKIDNLLSNVKENYSIELELREFEDFDQYDFKAKNEEIHQLKQQVKQLGPINLLAYSEYDEEKQRLDFLHKQRDDLLDSEKDVIKTIEEINTTAQNLFAETFEKIRENFVKIFRGLFNPGDEADLRLEENADPLEGKIEIIAKPKGKRPTSIELLSGGEKTLTAIALLFAIYLVKPSPFCILDEIDAPLDDANVDRFTKIIKDFSSDTQFIVVTHNKRTMEAASTLYGVTMQEEGISKLVSVRFNEDLNVA